MQPSVPAIPEQHDEAWDRILEQLRPELPSQQAYETWFRPLRLRQLSPQLLELEVPNLFFVLGNLDR